MVAIVVVIECVMIISDSDIDNNCAGTHINSNNNNDNYRDNFIKQ